MAERFTMIYMIRQHFLFAFISNSVLGRALYPGRHDKSAISVRFYNQRRPKDQLFTKTLMIRLPLLFPFISHPAPAPNPFPLLT